MAQLLLHLWGDYILQSGWMANNKTKSSLAAFIHALCYSLPFLWLCYVPWSRLEPEHFRWMAWFTIFGTHFFIDRYRLARYVVWVKNWLGLWPNDPWEECQGTGYPPEVPAWMAVWLMIIADNTLHLTINYCALRWL